MTNGQSFDLFDRPTVSTPFSGQNPVVPPDGSSLASSSSAQAAPGTSKDGSSAVASIYLEDCEHGLSDGVKVTPGVGGVPELAAEDLHAEEGEDEDEEEEDDEERGNGRDRVHQRLDQVPHRRPVPATESQQAHT